jgi:hypothetical protein
VSVSIVITNYNYGQFVGQAIDCALHQSAPDVQVIVIDDGSTDDSWDEIRRFGERIIARRIVNSGQGGASNVGLDLAQGEFIVFLDSDDLLDPTCVASCLALATPDVAKVQFAMRRIDGDGRALGGSIPYLMHEGDVLPIIRRFGHYAGPPSSGNFYRRSAIERYFPVPAQAWRRAADTVPFLLAPFHGTVVNAPEPLGSYRLHRPNATPGVLGNVGRSLAEQLRVEVSRRDAALALLEQRDGIRLEGAFLPLPWSMRTRALSWKLDPERHPYPDDTPRKLLRLQSEAMRTWPGYRPLERCVAQLWILAVTLLPTAMVARLAPANTSGGVRMFLRRLAGRSA